jgi:hypothetical protein
MSKYTEPQLITEIKRLADLLGRPPSYEDVRAHGAIHPACIQRKFAGWSNALKAAGFINPVTLWSPDSLTPEQGGWLAGFCAGEACFRISRPSPRSGGGLSHSYNPVFIVQLRSDDMPALEEMRRLWQLDNPVTFWSRDYDRSRGVKAGDGARLSVRDVPNLHYKIVATFKRYPLRTRKQHDFELFAQVIELMHTRHTENRANLRYTDSERERLDALYWQLREVKKFT